MFEDVVWFIVIFIISYIMWTFVLSRDLGPFSTVLKILGFVGVIVHEISHYLMCKLLNVPTESITVKYWNKGRPSPSGRVMLKEAQRISFLQGSLIALAPLFISTWLIFWSLLIAFTPSIEPMFFILALAFLISLLIGAAPSFQDFKTIRYAFERDPTYSIYQICLVLLSGLIVWGIIAYYQFIIPYSFISYILIGVGYFILKYSFIGIRTIIYKTQQKNIHRTSELNFRNFTRKSVKPARAYKIRIEEAQW